MTNNRFIYEVIRLSNMSCIAVIYLSWMTVWCINNNLYVEKLEATGLQQDTTSLGAATCEPSNKLPKRNVIFHTKVLKYRDLCLPMIACLNPLQVFVESLWGLLFVSARTSRLIHEPKRSYTAGQSKHFNTLTSIGPMDRPI